MPRFTFAIVFVLASAFLLAPRTASATSYSPFLQLEIKNGVYDNVTQSTVATSKAFTLYAYLTPIAGGSVSLATLLDTTYYITAALTPKVAVGADLGTFSFNSNVVRATQDMVYGNPPFEPNNPYPGETTGDLVRSDIYNTYFKEFSFKFKPWSSTTKCNSPGVNCATAYDVVNSPSITAPTDYNGGTDGQMYYMEFAVDTSNLNPNYQLNFDLYSTKEGSSSKDRDIKYLAAANYDARSKTMPAVPEPGSFLLIGTGVAALAAAQIRKRRSGR